jgi:hypothetical protein
MSTLVGSQAESGVQPRAIHAGVNSVYGDYDLAATLGVGDVVQLVKIPDGARIVGYTLQTTEALGTDLELNLGTRDNPDLLVASASCAASQIIGPDSAFSAVGGIGTVLDRSDADTTKYTMIEAVIAEAAGATSTGNIAVTINYTLDQ